MNGIGGVIKGAVRARGKPGLGVMGARPSEERACMNQWGFVSIEKWKENSMLLTKGLSPAFSGVDGRGCNKYRGAREAAPDSQPGGGRGWTERCWRREGEGPGTEPISVLKWWSLSSFPQFRGAKGGLWPLRGPASSDEDLQLTFACTRKQHSDSALKLWS